MKEQKNLSFLFLFFIHLRSLRIMIKKKYIIALLLKIFTGNIFHFQYIKSQYRQTNKTQKIRGLDEPTNQDPRLTIRLVDV